MVYLQYAAALILGLAGLWLCILNWRVFFVRHIQGKPAPSWIPLLPGALLCAGFALWPENPFRWLWWLGFIVDWGSLPGIGYSIVFHASGRGSPLDEDRS